ncbi:MAG: pitrilysin family protein, partial [Bacteroidota bacterium]
MPNRLIPPTVQLPRLLKLPIARRWTLTNGLQIVAIDGAKSPILRLELIFAAGRPYEVERLVARATNQLLAEGTKQRTAAELEEFFEFYGTSLRTPNLFDTGNLVVYTILPHLSEVLPVFAEVASQPAFTERDFDIYRKRSRQDLREDLTDPDTIAYRWFTELVFGKNHPYGYNGYPADYLQLSLADVALHHNRAYVANNATLLVAGKVTKEVEKLLEQHLGQLPPGQKLNPEKFVEQDLPAGTWQISRPKAQQTLVRRGRQLFKRDHPDFAGLEVLNTILGGYFGSRLMKNIREEKGYTYGIDSSVDFMRFGGYMTISADVANDNVAAVRTEID